MPGRPQLTVLSGAGASAESGIATFRDAQHALWADFDPAELATEQAWRRDPARVWAWYEWRRRTVMEASPNAGHLALAALESRYAVTVITQNVDDLHERAGSSQVVHLHGSLFAPRCFACARPGTFDGLPPPAGSPHSRLNPPVCKHCGGKVRPGVVWFGEALPPVAWKAAEAAMVNTSLLVVVGTSAIVQPAARLPERALRAEVPVLEINTAPVLAQQHPAVIPWPFTAASGLSALALQLL